MTEPTPHSGNLFHELPVSMTEELTEILAQARSIRIERIVSTGQSSPEGFWYDQHEHEWVCVLRGAARLEFAEPVRVVSLNAGDYILIKAHERHRVQWTDPDQPTVWLAVFFASD